MIHFSELRVKNILRCTHDFNHPLSAWSIAEWCCAMVGEAGEAANVAKKMIRNRDNMGRFNNKNPDELRQQLAQELADLVIYADLVAASEGIDLGAAIVEKFNADSRKHGSEVRL